MYVYQISAVLIDPVTQRKSRQSQVSEGLLAIRGTTLRGALARAYLNEYGVADERFERLFLSEQKTRFGSLQPWKNQIPITATSCKRAPGFADEDHSAHGVVDLLWLRVAEKLNGGPMIAPIAQKGMYCQHAIAPGQVCGAALKPFSGGWTEDTESPSPRYVQRPNTTVDMHVGIDRGTNAAVRAVLYALHSIEPTGGTPMTWNGVIHATEETWADLKALLDATDYRIRIGHAKTRGYGRVELHVSEREVPDQALSERDWSLWSTAAQEFLRDLEILQREEISAPTIMFSVTFPSGAIIVDEFLRYSLDPADMLDWLPTLTKPSEMPSWSPIVDCPDGKIRSLTAVTRHELIRGWQAAHGLPKTDEYALVSGAVYAYEYSGPVDWLWNRLRDLRRTGAGLRRNEGFGNVLISDPFHQLCPLSVE